MRQAKLQSDPILQDEKFANKFKFSVGEVLYKKIGVGKWKNVGQLPRNSGGNLATNL